MRIALVSYYAPPQPAVASHRVLRMTRALLGAGHQVLWVTQEEESLLSRDPTLASLVPEEVKVLGLGGPTLWSRPAARNLPEKVLRNLAWLAPKWLALPDSHLEWAWRLVRRLPGICREEGVEAVLLCCGPHGQILAVPRLRRLLPGLKILVDYRDLLSGNPWNEPSREGLRRRLLARERALLARADRLFLNTRRARERFFQVVGEIPGLQVEVVPNGADYGLAREVLAGPFSFDPGPGRHLGYFGTIFPGRRLAPVLEAAAALSEGPREKFRLHCFIGEGDSRALLEEDLARLGLGDPEWVVLHPLLPYGEALAAMRAMDALLLVNGPTPEDGVFVPGKIFDYLMARRPVLFWGSRGDAARIVERASGREWCFFPGDGGGLRAFLEEFARGGRPPDLEPVEEFGVERAFEPLLSALAAGGGGEK